MSVTQSGLNIGMGQQLLHGHQILLIIKMHLLIDRVYLLIEKGSYSKPECFFPLLPQVVERIGFRHVRRAGLSIAYHRR
jgi:hypothetical protein